MSGVMKVLTKVFGSRNERLLKRYRRIVEQVNQLETEVQKKSDAELRARTKELREGITSGKIRSADAMAVLQPVYDRFTEGFATAAWNMQRICSNN